LFFADLPVRHRARSAVFAVLFALAHGVGVEAIQPRVGRSFEAWDLAADGAGAVLFVLAYRRAVIMFPRVRGVRLPRATPPASS
jgi:VanZ family protein